MLPKVNRDDLLNQNGDSVHINGTTNNNIVRLLSEAPTDNYGGGTGGGGVGRAMSSKGVRRPISTKSAHLTPIPLEATFLSPAHQSSSSTAYPNPQQNNSNSHQTRSYLPYSASSPSRARHRVQINQQNTTASSSPMRWKGGGDGYKSEYMHRARAHSHRTPVAASNGKTWSARGGPPTSGDTKSMPYLVPKSARPKRVSSSSSKLTASSASDQHQQSSEEKICKKPEELQTSGIHLVGGMVVISPGKPGALLNGGVGGGPVSSSLTKDRVQVCRTKEEREKNPDTIRLDKRGVRVFPDIGGGESTTLKLLSLQHNLITRLENVPLLSQLVVLDLYDNRVERICGLQGLPSLRVLLLGKNRIKRIEGLDSLKRLEILDLHGNQLRYVDNLGSLCALRVLNLAGNLLRNIRNLGPYGMSSLTELNLKRNRIKNLEGLHKAPHLKKLLLANNDLQNISCLAPLRKLSYLNELVIEPNPLIGQVGSEYQSQVLTLFPNLGTLDRSPVTEEMKATARLWHKKKLDEEEKKKMEEERLRHEMMQTVGPPGSREQVIYQARRRWESLRNFVKSGPPSESSAKSGKKSSMKKVVSVVTEVKAKKQAEVLYPPATLDLEEFPDGQETLDQMESMLSCKQEEDDKQKGELKVENEKSQIAPTDNVPSFHPNGLDKREVKEISPETTVKENHDNESKTFGSGEPFEGDEGTHIISESQCPSSCSARSNSAKVAVVRPLVHRSNAEDEAPPGAKDNEEVPLPPQCSGITCNKNAGDVGPSSETGHEVVELIVSQQPITEKVADGNITFDELPPEIDMSSTTSSVPPPPMIQLPSVLSQVTEHDEDNSQEEVKTGEPQKQQQPPIQSESARVKSKLLKHLRSISLDSYPHPFLRPGGQKPEGGGEGSSINSASPMIPSDDDDDGGEEDDDNDNEVVQDYDCDDDDAYSIATSTCTTVTSGSTPRRSSTVMATTNRLLKNGVLRKQTFPRTRSQRIKMRDRAAKLFGSTSDLSPRSTSGTSTSKRVNSGTGSRCPGESTNGGSGMGRPPTCSGRILRRCDSAASLSTSGLVSSSSTSSLLGGTVNGGGNNGSSKIVSNGNNDPVDNQGGGGPSPYRKQGMDFLVEIEGKMLNVFGQGGLRHALTAFASNVTCHVATAKFHYISYDSIIPFFGKLRQVYPSLEHFHFRANNLCTLSQLDSLSDLQGLTSLFIAKEGNPIVNHEAWAHYASYRLSHWGLQIINGKEICSEYRGGASPAAQAKGFESLGFLALSCLPQTALTPLAKRLHMLHCFCCCSPSTSSDESNRRFTNPHHRLLQPPSQPTIDHSSSNGNFCTAWDDDPVLLDVIGKEALVYCPPALPPDTQGDNIDNPSINNFPSNYSSKPSPDSTTPSQPPSHPSLSSDPRPTSSSFDKRRAETLGNLVHSGVEIVEKVDMLEKTWSSLMAQVIQDMLMDFRFMDSYMKKELKKCQDITLINQQQQQAHGHQHTHTKKLRH